MNPAPKQLSPLREMEIQINKMARRKSDLQEFMTGTLNMRISGQEYQPVEAQGTHSLPFELAGSSGLCAAGRDAGQIGPSVAEDGAISEVAEINQVSTNAVPKLPKFNKSKPSGSQDELTSTVQLLAKSVQQMSSEIKDLKENQQGRRKMTRGSKDGTGTFRANDMP